MDRVVEGSMYKCWNSFAYFNMISMLESGSTNGWVASVMKHQRLGVAPVALGGGFYVVWCALAQGVVLGDGFNMGDSSMLECSI